MFLHRMTLNHIIAFSHVLPGKNTMTWHRQVTWKKAPNHHLHVVVKLQQNLGFFIMTEFLIVCRADTKSHEFLNTIFLFSNLIFVNVHTIKMIKVLVWILLFPFLQWKEIGNDGIIGDDDCRISSQWEFRCTE